MKNSPPIRRGVDLPVRTLLMIMLAAIARVASLCTQACPHEVCFHGVLLISLHVAIAVCRELDLLPRLLPCPRPLFLRFSWIPGSLHDLAVVGSECVKRHFTMVLFHCCQCTPSGGCVHGVLLNACLCLAAFLSRTRHVVAALLPCKRESPLFTG